MAVPFELWTGKTRQINELVASVENQVKKNTVIAY